MELGVYNLHYGEYRDGGRQRSQPGQKSRDRDELEVQHRAEISPDERNESWEHKIPRSGIPSWRLWTESDVFEVSIKILGFKIVKTICYRDCIQILNVNLLSVLV